MNFPPKENITYKTRLKEKEIIKRLSSIVEPEKTFRIGGGSKPYEGQITDQTFKISRIINYRNSFLPMINGVIEEGFDGLLIKTTMELHTFVKVFIYIWCGGVGFACIGVLGSSAFNLEQLIPFGMLLFMYVLTMVCFKYESNISKQDLKTLFEAEMIEGD